MAKDKINLTETQSELPKRRGVPKMNNPPPPPSMPREFIRVNTSDAINKSKKNAKQVPVREFERPYYDRAQNPPLMWHVHKLLCDIGWRFRHRFAFGWDMYYKHLDIMIKKYNYNYYGEKWNK